MTTTHAIDVRAAHGPVSTARSMLAAYADQRGIALRPGQLPIGGGSSVHLPGVSEDASLLVIPVVHDRPLTRDDAPQLARELFTLALARRFHGGDAVLLFANESVRDSALAGVRRLAAEGTVRLDVLSR